VEIDPTNKEARERLRAIDAKESKKEPKDSPLVSRLFNRKDS
jgi:hypothetical protein